MDKLRSRLQNSTLVEPITVSLGLLLLIFLLYARVFARPDQIAGPLIGVPSGDMVLFYAFESAIRSALANHQWPLWNPYFGVGTPLLANPQTSALYPLTALLRWLPITPFFNWETILHVWLAGLGTYFLLKDCKVRTAAAVFGTISYMLSGAVMPRIAIGHPVVIYAMAWPPWILLFYRRLLDRRSLPALIPTVMFTALELLTGHLQISAILLLIPVGYFLVGFSRRVIQRNFRDAWRVLFASIAVGLLSIGTASVMLIPTA